MKRQYCIQQIAELLGLAEEEAKTLCAGWGTEELQEELRRLAHERTR